MGGIGWEAIFRSGQNHTQNGHYIAVVSDVGIFINALTTFFPKRER